MNRVAAGVVRLAVRIVPADARERYQEEWAGDLAAATEHGVRAGDLASGAVRLAVGVRLREEAARTGVAGLWRAVWVSVLVVLLAWDLAAGSAWLLGLTSWVIVAVLLALRTGPLGRGQRWLGVAALAAGLLNTIVWGLLFAWEGEHGAASFSPGNFVGGLLSLGLDLRFLRVDDLGWWGPLTWNVVVGIITLYASVLSMLTFWIALGVGRFGPRRRRLT